MHRIILTGIAALTFGTIALPAAADVLIDYRDDAFRSGSPFYSAAERRDVEAALKTAPKEIAARFAKGFSIAGDATGAFTAPGAKERVLLIQDKAAVAIEPFPSSGAPLLLIMQDKRPIGFRLLPGDVQYQRLVAASDVDADGRDEVFLEASFMNMGQTAVSLDVVAVGDGETAKVKKTLENVYFDGCDNPTGEKSRSASTISIDNGLKTKSFKETCPR